MRDELLHFYERELAYLRRTGVDFARRYPRVAGRLQLEPNKCDDPHVERILEGFAFLSARVHLKLEDDFSQFSEALLGLLYPHYTRPVPSMSMAEFQLDPDQGKLSTGVQVPRGTVLYHTAGDPGVCKFTTCYDTTLWPIRVASARWLSPHELRPGVGATGAVAALSVQLECLPDVDFSKLQLDDLRLHLNAEMHVAASLYELLLNSCDTVLLREPTADGQPTGREPVVLRAGQVLRAGGFGENEGMLPAGRRAFSGYQLLLDYFAFPEKFLFLELGGLGALRERGFGSRVEIVFLVRPFERADRHPVLQTAVSAETIRLGCTPIVNLFPQVSEPVSVSPREFEHLVIADARRREATGIFSVDEVRTATSEVRFEPLYSFRHGSDGTTPVVFWHATRQPSGWRTDEDTDVYLSFADASARTLHPDVGAVTASLTCHNGALPTRLPFGSPEGDFQLQGGGPIQKVVSLVRPTAPLQPALGRPQLWRLVSQLSLNYVSLVDGGTEALQELLRLHNPSQSAAGERQIRGIVELRGEPCYSRIDSPRGVTFARGQRVEIVMDEESFTGSGAYLLASVLERFLGMYVSLNSFSRLVARTRQRKAPMREWAPRSGCTPLL
jgi:type VI secretion system protein ImpG